MLWTAGYFILTPARADDLVIQRAFACSDDSMRHLETEIDTIQ